MAILEKGKLSARNREFWTILLLVVRDAQLGRGMTTDWTRLIPLGSILLGGELDKRPKDSVWWVQYDGVQVKLHDDFGKWKRLIRSSARGLDVDDALKERNRRRWGNALAVVAIAGAITVTVATGGAAAAVIGPGAAAILGSVGATVGATAAALGDMVRKSGEGLTLAEIADGLKEGAAYYEAVSEAGILPADYELPEIERVDVPSRPRRPSEMLIALAPAPGVVPLVEPARAKLEKEPEPPPEGVGAPMLAAAAVAAIAGVGLVGALGLGAVYFATRRV